MKCDTSNSLDQKSLFITPLSQSSTYYPFPKNLGTPTPLLPYTVAPGRKKYLFSK